ncbi:unnamed protein product [Adineta steineri]|uniref:Uncharacterized protein n=1 Tax=Adineta steineri TaxID=433720 RepID=A0A814UK75_9BILA|nr:unnamed protein product [Adineta steineri]
MFNLLDGQLFSNVVSRVEQSRFSYTSQNEEFHNLNTNLQTYLSDIKRIDDENGELQKTIEQIRTNYILTLENHLQRLPEDFREESRILTDAHLERYKSKTRAKRFINQREEFKKRITFVANNEKEQVKYINYLQKQERSVQKELKVLSDQFQNLYKSIEREKQIHQQAMDKVDQLQIQLEQICIERSKTEFEIQNLREEVKLMQTAKEFLNDEYETILSTQTEANEYFISCLDESIINIREDFDDLNKRQLKQVENEYKQMIKILEENSLTTANINETTMNHQRKTQFECEKLQDEHQSIAQELTTLNDHNQILSERIFAMESDLFTIRDEHIQDLIIKDDELEQSKNELQSLHNKLSHLTEYDRNLKFELTLYRGVLESEYRRKQQQQQSNNNQQLARPTILRTTITRNNKNVPVLTSHNQFETINEQGNSIFEVTISKKNHIIDEKNKNRQELEQEDNLTRPWKKSFIEDEFENVQSTNTNSQGEHQISIVSPKQQSSPELQLSTKNFETLVANDSPSPDRSNSLNDDQTSPENSNLPTALPDEDQQTRMDNQKLSTTPPSIVPENSSEVQETSTSPADSEKQQIFLKDSQSSLIQPEDEHEFSEVDQSLITSQNDKETSSTNSPMNEETSLTTANNIVQPSNQSILSEDHRSLSNSQEEIRHSSSISSIDEQKPKISPMNTTEAAADLSVSLDDYRSHLLQQEDKDEPIEISQTSSLQSEEQSTSSKADQSHVTFEEQDQQLLTRSPTEKQIPLEMQQSSASPTNSAPSDLHQVSSDQQDQLQIYSKHQRSPSQSQEEIQQLSTRSPIEEEIPSEIQKSRSSSTNSTSSKDLPATSEAHNLSSEQLEEQQKSPEHDRSLSISQEEVHQLSTSLPLEEQVSSEKQKSRTSSTNSISSKDLPVTLEAHNLSSDQFDERQESPRHDRSLSTSQEEVHQLSTSLPIEEEIPSDIQKSRSSSTDSGSLKDLLVQSAVRQPSSDQQEKQGQSQTHRSSLSSSQEEPEQLLIKSPTEEQASFEFQKSPTSRTSTTSSEILQSSLNQPERQQQSPEHRRSVTSWPEDAEQLFTKTPIEEQIPFKTQKSPTSPTSTSSSQAHHLSSEQLEEQQESPKDHRSPYTSQEEIQQLSTISPKEEKEPFEVQKSPTSRNSSASH